MRFYGYTLADTMNEYARSFFSLVNSMYRLQAEEQIRNIEVEAVANGSNEAFEGIKKKSKGLHGIIQEVRIVKK